MFLLAQNAQLNKHLIVCPGAATATVAMQATRMMQLVLVVSVRMWVHASASVGGSGHCGVHSCINSLDVNVTGVFQYFSMQQGNLLLQSVMPV